MCPEDPVWQASNDSTDPSTKIQNAANQMTDKDRAAEEQQIESRQPEDSTEGNREADAAMHKADQDKNATH